MQPVRSFSMYFDHHRNVRFEWFGRFHLHTGVREKVLKTTLLLTHCDSFLRVYFYDRLYIILLCSFLYRMPAASTMTGGRALLLCTNTDNCIYQSVNG